MRTNGFIAWSCQLLLKQKGGSLRHVLDFLFFPCMWISQRLALRFSAAVSHVFVCFLSFLPYCHLPSCLLARFYPVTPEANVSPVSTPCFFCVFCFPARTFEDLFKPFLCVSFVFPGYGNTLLRPTPPWPWDQLWKVLSTLSSGCKYTDSCVE